ncbi:MAG: sulfite exporter TauE/SafE family protein [Chloroflexia bacterium]
MDFWVLPAFTLLGILLGTFGTIIGAGGGFLLVPVLLLLGWPHQEAAGTSLFMVTANAASGSLSYLRQKRVDLASAWRFGLATVPGAILGPQLAAQISNQAFNIVFGMLLIALAVYLFARPEKRLAAAVPGEHPPRAPGPRGWGWTVRDFVDSRGRHWIYAYPQFWALVLSFGVGFMSSVFGIGGGIIHVPALTNLFNFPAHIATATSHFTLMISAATGTVGYLANGVVRLPQGIALAIGAIIGAQIGGAVSNRVNGKWIARGLAIALTVAGVRLLLG